MSEETGGAVETVKKSSKKSGKRKASGAPRQPRTNLIEAEFGEIGVIAAKAYFSKRKAEKKELLGALRAKSKAADPEKVAKIQARIAVLTAKLDAATNSAQIIAKYRTAMQGIATLVDPGVE